MIRLDNDHLLMIEPKLLETDPIDDELTTLAKKVFITAKTTTSWRGSHGCICGVRSDCFTWVLPSGLVTNSLMVHYIESHRSEIPLDELRKLNDQIIFGEILRLAYKQGKGIIPKDIMLYALMGLGTGTIQQSAKFEKEGLAEFYGYQWNENFRWNFNKLTKLPMDRLISLWNEVKNNDR